MAVLVPCYNEATTIARVVADFAAALPDAIVHVFDNASEDDTLSRAALVGAVTRSVRMRGKGNVVRRMFADVDADIYVLVDGDDTYSAAHAGALVAGILDGQDMVVGIREATVEAAYRPGHVFGNRMLTTFLSRLFGSPCRDILSGYRAFSRRFVKSFPLRAAGFEIETELTVHALQLRMPVGEVVTPYKDRPSGSSSKLNTWRDGFRILRTMAGLFATERPVPFYGAIGGILLVTAIVLGEPLVQTYLHTGLVPRFPTAILVAALLVISALSTVIGVVLDSVARGRWEVKMLTYLGYPGHAWVRAKDDRPN
ncbi:glycosyl transferase [Lysobacteraceae bacterium NML93-0399]|nr:glycosyl transferase [Xanthomonadaceae bacterium NML93-0399]